MKKDHLQIRISRQLKASFIERLAQDGLSASDVVRRMIADYIAHGLPETTK